MQRSLLAHLLFAANRLPRVPAETEDRGRDILAPRAEALGFTIKRTVSPKRSANCISLVTLNFDSLPRTSKLASG
jgi:hypothetical protein